jgi:hypothetical protein
LRESTKSANTSTTVLQIPGFTALAGSTELGDFRSFLVQWKSEVERCDEPERLAKNFEAKVHVVAREELIAFIKAK